jgi:hypothetical protein
VGTLPAKARSDGTATVSATTDPNRVLRLVSGWDFTCARLASGKVMCWGDWEGAHLDLSQPTVRVASGVEALAVAEQRLWMRRRGIWSSEQLVKRWVDHPVAPIGDLIADGVACKEDEIPRAGASNQ